MQQPLSQPSDKLPDQALLGLVTADLAQPTQLPVEAIITFLQGRMPHPAGLQAVLFYGSGLWKKLEADSICDLYLLVDDLADFDIRWSRRFLGKLLAPNVYYLEMPLTEVVAPGARAPIMRFKVAVLTGAQFATLCAGRGISPQIWARFAQPTRLIWARDPQCGAAVASACAQALVVFTRRAVFMGRKLGPAILAQTQDDAQLMAWWAQAFARTFAAELRSESADRPSEIAQASANILKMRLRLAVQLLWQAQMGVPSPAGPNFAAVGRRSWVWHFPRLLRPWQKMAALCRLIKALLTFDGAIDYALWKIARHSGQHFQATAFQRRYPLIGGWALLWKIYRSKALR